MKILIVKMSSMGDVIHALPAVTDLKTIFPSAQIDWVVEEAFADIPRAHSAVNKVIPVAIRRWRKAWFHHRHEIRAFRQNLQNTAYDVVLDAQGLLKSAIVCRLATRRLSSTSGQKIHGLDAESIREPIASWFYGASHHVARDLHAVERVRRLFAASLGYELNPLTLDYGISKSRATDQPRLLFLHGTTWASKHWPESCWRDLIKCTVDKGFSILLPHGDAIEQARAERLANNFEAVQVLPRSSISELMQQMKRCSGVVSVDTGLGHLAAAMDIPMIGIYGSTNPILTGPHGGRQEVIVSDNLPCIPCLKRECQFKNVGNCSSIHPPCYQEITAEVVFDRLTTIMAQSDDMS